MTIVVTIAIVVVIEMAEMDAWTVAAVLAVAVAVAEAIIVGYWRSCVIQEVMDRYTGGGRVAWEGRYRVLMLVLKLMLMFDFLSLCGGWWCWWSG